MGYKKIVVSKKAPNKNCLWLRPITREGETYYGLFIFGSKGWEGLLNTEDLQPSPVDQEETIGGTK